MGKKNVVSSTTTTKAPLFVFPRVSAAAVRRLSLEAIFNTTYLPACTRVPTRVKATSRHLHAYTEGVRGYARIITGARRIASVCTVVPTRCRVVRLMRARVCVSREE